MRITLKQDIEAPAEHVWAEIADAPAFERQALRRGVRLRRLDGGPGIGPGAGWQATFPWRGREREMRLAIERMEPPGLVATRIESGGLWGESTAEVLPLSRGATRLVLVVEIRARTLAARLLVQSLRLARGSLERRGRERLRAWARDVEARWQRQRARG